MLDWESHRDVLEDLYMKRDWPLMAVRAHMAEDHKFEASRGQYQTQFNRWVWKKQMNAAKWKYVSEKLEERKDRPSAVYFYGRRFKDTKVKNEISRYVLPRLQVGNIRQDSSVAPRSPDGVLVCTPRPSSPTHMASCTFHATSNKRELPKDAVALKPSSCKRQNTIQIQNQPGLDVTAISTPGTMISKWPENTGIHSLRDVHSSCKPVALSSCNELACVSQGFKSDVNCLSLTSTTEAIGGQPHCHGSCDKNEGQLGDGLYGNVDTSTPLDSVYTEEQDQNNDELNEALLFGDALSDEENQSEGWFSDSDASYQSKKRVWIIDTYPSADLSWESLAEYLDFKFPKQSFHQGMENGCFVFGIPRQLTEVERQEIIDWKPPQPSLDPMIENGDGVFRTSTLQTQTEQNSPSNLPSRLELNSEHENEQHDNDQHDNEQHDEQEINTRASSPVEYMNTGTPPQSISSYGTKIVIWECCKCGDGPYVVMASPDRCLSCSHTLCESCNRS